MRNRLEVGHHQIAARAVLDRGIKPARTTSQWRRFAAAYVWSTRRGEQKPPKSRASRQAPLPRWSTGEARRERTIVQVPSPTRARKRRNHDPGHSQHRELVPRRRSCASASCAAPPRRSGATRLARRDGPRAPPTTASSAPSPPSSSIATRAWGSRTKPAPARPRPLRSPPRSRRSRPATSGASSAAGRRNSSR